MMKERKTLRIQSQFIAIWSWSAKQDLADVGVEGLGLSVCLSRGCVMAGSLGDTRPPRG